MEQHPEYEIEAFSPEKRGGGRIFTLSENLTATYRTKERLGGLLSA
jgi:hypothetical protein